MCSYSHLIWCHSQVCIGLRYLATGACLQLLCDVQGKCCKATLSTNVNRFIDYLACMSRTNVRFPEVKHFLFIFYI